MKMFASRDGLGTVTKEFLLLRPVDGFAVYGNKTGLQNWQKAMCGETEFTCWSIICNETGQMC